MQGENKTKEFENNTRTYIYIKSLSQYSQGSFSFNATETIYYISRAGQLRTRILTDTMWVHYLRITRGTQCQKSQK